MYDYMNTISEYTLRIFVNTWGNYNENGADGGEWLELPMDETELQEELDRIAEAMGDSDPEWCIHDYEWGAFDMGEISEYDSIDKWNEICQELDMIDGDDMDVIKAAIEAWSYTPTEALDRFQRGYFTFYPGMDLDEVAEELVEECYFTKDTPDIFRTYFDYAAFARDLRFDGYEETSLGVICDC